MGLVEKPGDHFENNFNWFLARLDVQETPDDSGISSPSRGQVVTIYFR